MGKSASISLSFNISIKLLLYPKFYNCFHSLNSDSTSYATLYAISSLYTYDSPVQYSPTASQHETSEWLGASLGHSGQIFHGLSVWDSIFCRRLCNWRIHTIEGHGSKLLAKLGTLDMVWTNDLFFKLCNGKICWNLSIRWIYSDGHYRGKRMASMVL